MGREQRRKEQKQRKITKNEEFIDTSINGLTILKLAAAVVIILFVLYYAVAIFVTKELDVSNNNDNSSSETNSNNPTSISNKILAANIFNQKEEKYYVYFYDFSNKEDLVSTKLTNNNEISNYLVDTSSSLNSKYITSENSNPSAKSVSELKVKEETLLEITNDTITGYYEGSSKILDFLNK